jgi:DNA-binding GntR family transcriptional regulator
MTHIQVDHSILGGTRLWRGDEEVDATAAGPSMAELLGVPKRELLLRIRKVIYSTKGVVNLYVLAVLIVPTS